MPQKPPKRYQELAILSGNFLEYYDFVLFSALLPVLTPLFFPSSDSLTSLIWGYLFMGIGFLGRPLGAFIFGHLGDIYGRKKALTLSLFFMLIPTLIIGLMPGYDKTGPLGTAFIFLARWAQGICLGGESAGAGLFLTENAPPEKRYQKGALLNASSIAGAGFSSIVASICCWPGMPSETWRMAFIAGVLIGAISLVLRFNLSETRDFSNAQDEKNISFSQLFQHYRTPLLCSICFAALLNVTYYMMTGFINTYFASMGAFPKHHLMLLTSTISILTAILVLISGRFIHLLNPPRIMAIVAAFLSLYALPLFWFAQSKSLWVFALSQLIIIVFLQLFSASSFAYTATLFPVKARYKGIAIGFTLGSAFFAGFTPYISAWLIKLTQWALSPGLYLMFISLLGFWAVRRAQRLPKHEHVLAHPAQKAA